VILNIITIQKPSVTIDLWGHGSRILCYGFPFFAYADLVVLTPYTYSKCNELKTSR